MKFRCNIFDTQAKEYMAEGLTLEGIAKWLAFFDYDLERGGNG